MLLLNLLLLHSDAFQLCIALVSITLQHMRCQERLVFLHQHPLAAFVSLASHTAVISDKYGSIHLNTGMRFNKIIFSHLILIVCLRKYMDMHEHQSAI